jgi:hypothetical protein
MNKFLGSGDHSIVNCNSFSLISTNILAQSTLAQFPSYLVIVWVLIANLLFVEATWAQDSKRPFYEYPGDYRQQVNQLKDEFKLQFGYELIDLELGWKPDEIKELTLAFSKLPDTFLNIPGLKGFYHLSKLRAVPEGMPVDDVPASTFPKFQTVYRNSKLSYLVEVDNQEPRIEFFNSLFYEDSEQFQNIVQHEMAHIFDIFHGYLSFSKEWLEISNFSLIHLPALDGRPGDDYLFTTLNDPDVVNYAPVSTRQLSTYSRQDPQEDFANSVSAYINYPYFRYSHPKRYQYLKNRVFGGREYYPSTTMNYQDKVVVDFDAALNSRNWNNVIKISQEVGRGYFPEIESQLIERLKANLKNSPDSRRDAKLGGATCYFLSPKALDIRRNLIRKKRVPLKTFLKISRCGLMSLRSFEKEFSKRSMERIYFFKNKDKAQLQFLDPALPISGARGFETRYLWRIFYEGSNVHIAEGTYIVEGVRSGSIKIDLEKSVVGTLNLPTGKSLVLELGAQRMHPREFKRFNSNPNKIRFVIQPGFNYKARKNSEIKVIYPEGTEFKS